MVVFLEISSFDAGFLVVEVYKLLFKICSTKSRLLLVRVLVLTGLAQENWYLSLRLCGAVLALVVVLLGVVKVLDSGVLKVEGQVKLELVLF